MARAPFQVLVIPFKYQTDNQIRYGVFRRSDCSMWQFVAGGGEDGEAPIVAAMREAREEAMVPDDVEWISLDSMATIPRSAFPGCLHWRPDLYVVPEYCFAVDMTGRDAFLSAEHDLLEWLTYVDARNRLTWQSNQNALWELHERLIRSHRSGDQTNKP